MDGKKKEDFVVRKKTKFLFIASIAFLLLMPVAFLLFKNAPNGQMESKPLKKTAASAPSYDNFLNLGLAYINSNKPEMSLEPLEKARALKPRSAVVYNNLGVAYIMLKRFDEGIAACRKAIDLDPSFQLAKNNLNWGLAEKDKLKGK